MLKRISPVIVTLAALGLGPVSASGETPIATTKYPTPIRSWGGVAAFSLYDKAAGAYRLAISRHGGPPEILAVAAQPAVFDVDVGPDSAGSPALVYSLCASPGRRPRGCDLYRYSLSRRSESKLVGASVPKASEIAPTIWGARIAWAQLSDSGATRRPRIYTRTLRAPRSRPSRRVHGIPSRLCRNGCTVNTLELHARRLALNVGYPGPVCDNTQVRLGSLAGRSIQIANTACGLDGQTLVGVSLDARNLYFARFCQGAPISCDRVGAFRYSLRTGKYSLARFGRRLTGFSYDSDGRAYEVLAPDTYLGYCGNALEEDEAPPPPVPQPPPDCQIVLSNPLTFSSARAPH